MSTSKKEWKRAYRLKNHARILAYERLRYKKNIERERKRNREKARRYTAHRLLYARERRLNNLEKCRAYARNWKKANALKIRAHSKVKRAIDAGKIKRQPCKVCGLPNGHAHHTDYMQPFKIIWLCQKHHNEAHRQYA